MLFDTCVHCPALTTCMLQLASCVHKQSATALYLPQGESTDDGSRKDANEVLVKDGARALRAFLEASPPFPIKGLHSYSDFKEKIFDMYDGVNDGERPVSTGWRVLDDFYRVAPGELTVVTGALFLCTICVACVAIRTHSMGRRVLDDFYRAQRTSPSW